MERNSTNWAADTTRNFYRFPASFCYWSTKKTATRSDRLEYQKKHNPHLCTVWLGLWTDLFTGGRLVATLRFSDLSEHACHNQRRLPVFIHWDKGLLPITCTAGVTFSPCIFFRYDNYYLVQTAMSIFPSMKYNMHSTPRHILQTTAHLQFRAGPDRHLSRWALQGTRIK